MSSVRLSHSILGPADRGGREGCKRRNMKKAWNRAEQIKGDSLTKVAQAIRRKRSKERDCENREKQGGKAFNLFWRSPMLNTFTPWSARSTRLWFHIVQSDTMSTTVGLHSINSLQPSYAKGSCAFPKRQLKATKSNYWLLELNMWLLGFYNKTHEPMGGNANSKPWKNKNKILNGTKPSICAVFGTKKIS